MRILLIGKNGQVGRELHCALPTLGEVIALGRAELDIASPDAIRQVVRAIRPDIIVNAAAYTAVDRAELEPELAMVINGTAPGILAEEARRIGALLVHYSTDYVFDGTKKEPYVETDIPNPLNAYGRSKLAGEEAILASGAPHFIFRTSWVYAAQGHNFLNTILRLAKERDELRIVDDQVGAPTWAHTIAKVTAQILSKQSREYTGLYHLTASGATTWFGFACAILDEIQQKLNIQIPRLTPVSSSEYSSQVRRPANSLLSNSCLTKNFAIHPSEWITEMRMCIGLHPLFHL